MKSFLISYELTLPGTQYGELVQFFQSNPVWARPLPSLWIIQMNDNASAQSVRDAIKQRVSSNDKVFVVEITKATWGTSNISREVTEWMRNAL